MTLSLGLRYERNTPVQTYEGYASMLDATQTLTAYNSQTVEIATNVVWRVTDTAQALFDVDDYNKFVFVQIESAVRAIAAKYPYDDIEHQETTLRGNADIVNDELKGELQDRVAVAGITIDECRLTHLAYAQEIAQAMQDYGAYIADKTNSYAPPSAFPGSTCKTGVSGATVAFAVTSGGGSVTPASASSSASGRSAPSVLSQKFVGIRSPLHPA